MIGLIIGLIVLGIAAYFIYIALKDKGVQMETPKETQKLELPFELPYEINYETPPKRSIEVDETVVQTYPVQNPEFGDKTINELAAEMEGGEIDLSVHQAQLDYAAGRISKEEYYKRVTELGRPPYL